MIDTLVRLLPAARERFPEITKRFQLPEQFSLVTLHRTGNVDNGVILANIMDTLEDVSARLPLLFPIHPRTREKLRWAGITLGSICLSEPLSYLDFLALQDRASVVITDSGGVQEETTFLGTPCLTLRENTERPITVAIGTNRLIGQDLSRLDKEVTGILNMPRTSRIPELWDGKTGARTAEVLARWAASRTIAAGRTAF